jgi:hypothetical protein
MMRSTSKRYRTKEQMAKDVLAALNAPMSDRAKEVVLLDVFSAWTQSAGKYNGCQYWSDGAWKLHPRLECQLYGKGEWKNLRHEHAVPKSVLRRELWSLNNPTEETVAEYLECYLVGVVVTVEEDKRLNKRFKSEMPPGFWKKGHELYFNFFARYRLCGIKIGLVLPGDGVGCRKVDPQWIPLPDTEVPGGAERIEESI